MAKQISILGSTGSIGVNALKIASHLKNELDVVYLTANKNSALLIEQANQFQPKGVCIVDETAFLTAENALVSSDIELLKGRAGLLELAKRDDVDIVLNGLVGALGMEPTLCAI